MHSLTSLIRGRSPWKRRRQENATTPEMLQREPGSQHQSRKRKKDIAVKPDTSTPDMRANLPSDVPPTFSDDPTASSQPLQGGSDRKWTCPRCRRVQKGPREEHLASCKKWV